MKLDEIYHSSNVNRTPKCMSLNGDFMLYGSSNAIVQAKIGNKSINVVSVISGGHSERVNCVKWIDESRFVSGSSDGSIVLWERAGDEKTFKIMSSLKNHSKSVTSISVLLLPSDGSILIASTSGDSTLKVSHIVPSNNADENPEVVFSLDFHTGYALDVKLGNLFYEEGKSLEKPLFEKDPAHVMKGHEDWIQGIDIFSDDKSLNLIATSGQDGFIRIWNICVKEVDKNEGKDVHGDPSTNKDLFNLDENEYDLTLEDKVALKMEEIIIKCGDEQIQFTLSLETILYGHEDKVYEIHWGKSKSTPTLLSCSLDKTMLIWEAPQIGSEDNIWIEKMRVGEIGGNTLGFLGCQFGRDGEHIIGYSFNGALHYWYEEDNRWNPGVAAGGHFGPVEDIGWEQNGSYLLSVSSDQTTRIHAPWQSSFGVQWHEIARPNVHGHDLSCLAILSDHSFVLGADEKKNLDRSEISRFAQGASVPSLGLSNKAVFEGSSSVPENEDTKHVKDQFPEFYFVDSSYSDPPPEETLIQNTLWPEIRKLYAHGYEIFRLASNSSGSLVASVCKAKQAEHASIILWNTTDWSLKQKLEHHGLTVTAMDFSPCDRYLLSGSRDRSWALFEKSEEGSFTPISSPSVKGKGYPHQRLIWSVGFSRDSKYFFTTSRDKKIADSVTSGVFVPHEGEDYEIAVGLENGKVSLLSFSNNELKIEYTCHPHHKTVKKLVMSSNGLLASCSSDKSSMSATATKVKPDLVCNEKQSFRLIEKDIYESRSFGSQLLLDTFKKEAVSSHEEIKEVVELIKDAMDAVRKKYLNQLILSFYEKSPDEPIENYSFFFGYENDNLDMSVSFTEEETVSHRQSLNNTKQELQSTTVSVFQTLKNTLEKVMRQKKLKSGTKWTYTLKYYAHTPKDYHIPNDGFYRVQEKIPESFFNFGV
ncbi:ELP2 [Lepeophtheirus salmonis]|uniref:Elongator complex protein 2 n=1 Tax=Lepeophtheirus salmonis TaxID=72036 RepID=A0A7R8CN11_LEPSM|nr:ELP2 [Lepeophtheirus salmonis]CAF2842153.1 ELP2 [Lepeophtheirus salmonis]